MSSVLCMDGERASGPDFSWGRIRWLLDGRLVPDAQMTVGLVFIEPGMSNPAHYHPNCEEILFVLSGRCEHRLGESWYPLGPGQMIRIPQGVVHAARNTSWEPLRALIAYSSPDRQTVFLEGPNASTEVS